MTSICRLFILLTVAIAGCALPEPENIIHGQTMGTTYTVRVADCPASLCTAALREAVDSRLIELTRIFSHFDAESELSAFNRHQSSDWFAVSDELAFLTQISLHISDKTDGAFDITVASAVNAWGFGPDSPESAPETAALDLARQLTDYRKLSAQLVPAAIRKSDPAISIDMSAIAKGFAADQIALLLEDRGIRNYLVEVGGEVRCAGLRPDRQPWKIAIERPDDTLGIQFIVAPGDGAVATSGDYRNFYILNGKRISHSVDPRTAMPTQNGLAAVSVIAPDAMQADAFATAFMVLGLESGKQLALDNDYAVMFASRSDAGISTYMTPAFERFVLAD